MRRPLLRFGFACAAVLALACVARASTLFANGSFETGPDPGVSMALAVGSTAVSGWVVTRAPIDYVGTDWSAAQGARSIALNGTGPGAIAQTIPTQVHAGYTVRLYMAGDPGSTPVVKWLRVVAGNDSAEFSKDITGMWAWDPGWDLRTFTFTADSQYTTVEFVSLMSGDTGPTVDSVSVELTSLAGVEPGPMTLSLAVVGANPAGGAPRLAFTLPNAGPARLRVLDVAGREVARLADGDLPAGRGERTWSARAPDGIYFASLEAGGRRIVRRLTRVH